ncbi:MAG: XdhC family protein [Flammeovirgaceae bacterium]|nr:XdhC family protein [Flammeovirgaceae bacterium]
MHEIQRIVEVYDRIDFTQKKAALATVVKLYGSSYRRPGARMLMTDDGRWIGAISGGCLEGDALRKARKAIMSGEASLVTYDTMDDENNSLGIALGCNGIIDVLIEPLDPENEQNPIELLRNAVNDHQQSIIATVYKANGSEDIKIGDRLLVDYSGKEINTLKGKNLYNLITADIEKVVAEGKSVSKVYEMLWGEAEVFIEALIPSIQLVIFGGGYDAAPLAQFGSSVGWNVVVTDNCIAHLAPKRFPTAKDIVASEPSGLLQKIKFNSLTAVVLMSHDYNKDSAVLKAILPAEVPYIGILGPKKRGDKMLERMNEEGIELNDKLLETIHNPVGLDIGAETPEEIAISIIAEIQAKFANRKGGMLKNREGFIHERREDGDNMPESNGIKTVSCPITPGNLGL